MTDNTELKKEFSEFNNPFSEALEAFAKMINESKEKKRYEYLNMSPVDKFKLWVRCDSWNLKTEAIPLIMGVSPNFMHSINNFNWRIYNDIYAIAKKCIGNGEGMTLDVIDIAVPEKQWTVEPYKFLQWAVGKK